jgi:hypothetical protein
LSPGYSYSVDCLTPREQARSLVKDADLIVAEQAGRYVVKGGARGSGDEDTVAAVAACLKTS